MSRPQSIADLPKFALAPHDVATVNINTFAHDGRMLAAYGQFVNAAEDAGFDVTSAGITLALTGEEKEDKLKSAQNSWDNNEKAYQAALNGGEEPKYNWGLKDWCQREGVDYPFPEAE